MARLRTVDQIIQAARERSDQEVTGFVSGAEAIRWCSDSAARFHAKLSRADPLRFYEATTITTSSGALRYPLPANFGALLGVDRISGSDAIPLEPFHWNDRRPARLFPRYMVQGSSGTLSGGSEELVLDGDPGAISLRVHYSRAAVPLTAGADTVDGAFGGDQWITLDLAATMASKAEDFELAAALRAERDALERETIQHLSAMRDLGSAPQCPPRRRGLRHPRAR